MTNDVRKLNRRLDAASKENAGETGRGNTARRTQLTIQFSDIIYLRAVNIHRQAGRQAS